MAENIQQTSEDKTIEKAVWHYVGIGVLWTSLFLTGMAFERLGLTSSLFLGVFPGEVGSLRRQVTECEQNLGAVNADRDKFMQQEASLRLEIQKLQNKVAAATMQ